MYQPNGGGVQCITFLQKVLLNKPSAPGVFWSFQLEVGLFLSVFQRPEPAGAEHDDRPGVHHSTEPRFWHWQPVPAPRVEPAFRQCQWRHQWGWFHRFIVFFQRMWRFGVFLCWRGEATQTFAPFRVSCGSNLPKWPKAHPLVSESLQKWKAEKSLLASVYQLFMLSRGLCTRQSLYSLPSSTRRLKAVPLTQR